MSLGGNCHLVLKPFEAATLFHPVKITDIHPHASAFQHLRLFHFLQGAISDLQKELLQYLPAVEGMSPEKEVLK